MSKPQVELLGISNAIVDVLCHVEPEFVSQFGNPPGSMTLIDRDDAERIYDMMGPATESAGGSVANTVACFASLGGEAAYIGRVAEDQLGRIFNHDMASLGVDVRLPEETRAAPTARCHVLIAPDGERTMQTFLGACTEIAETDVTLDTVGAPKLLLMEGYVWDTPEGPAAMQAAITHTQAAGGRVALSLSDSFCVERHHAAFLALAQGDADLVIGNEAEVRALFGGDNLDNVRERAAASGKLVVMTRHEHGSEVFQGDQHIVQAADTVERVVDSTGAGDAWVAGFLFGVARGYALKDATGLATQCATLALSQVGARPQPSALAKLVSD
ncbi:MAG: adenosine kinase [Pseudomonadota bacterium]